MNENKTIHIEGFLQNGEDYIEIYENVKYLGTELPLRIARRIEEHIGKNVCKPSVMDDRREERDDTDTDFYIESTNIPKVNFRAYFSDKKISLEEAIDKQILASIGELDILVDWYGYSEWTIMGYDVTNFKLTSIDGGKHDLGDVFENYVGKYVHILIDILEV